MSGQHFHQRPGYPDGNCSGSGAGVSPAMAASRPWSHRRGQEARSGRRDARPPTSTITPDDLKLRSSMTLFASVAASVSAFSRVLEQYYDSQPDTLVLSGARLL